MNEETIKIKRELAEKAVEGMTDEKLKLVAFEVILTKLLADESSHAKPSEMPVYKAFKEEMKVGSTEIKQKTFSPESLAKELGLELDRLKNVIEFTEDDFHIISNIPGEKDWEKQLNASLVVLTINYYCRGEREVLAGDLRNILQDLGIRSLLNMATNITYQNNFIVKIGKPGSHYTRYRITNPGLQNGIDIIKNMLSSFEGGDRGR